MTLKGRAPTTAEKQYMDAVTLNGCIVCRLYLGVFTPCEIHHIEGKTAVGAHFKILGLCYLHHRGGMDCVDYTSRHPYKSRFEERYGTEYELLEKQNGLIDG